MELEEIRQRLQDKFPESILGSDTFRGEITICLKAEEILPICRFLRDDLHYNYLTDLCGVDHCPCEPRFGVVYHLCAMETRERLRLKVALDGADPSISSVTSVWKGADWMEREAFDMYGIRFEGHPDLRRILLPPEWEGYPLRKDYPLRGLGNEKTKILNSDKFILWEYMANKETMVINMGPQHPSTHGVLRIVLELDGEVVVKATPDVGFLHRGIEKLAENRTYHQCITLTDRLDYVAGMSNNLAYVLAVEKLFGMEAPPRAQAIRVILSELQRIASHLLWLGTHAHDIGAMTPFFYTLRERDEVLFLFERVCGARLTPSYFRVGGLARDLPEGFENACREFLRTFQTRVDEYETLLTKNTIWMRRTRDVGTISGADAVSWGISGPVLRASNVNWDLRKAMPYCGYENYEFTVPLGQNGDVYDRYCVRIMEMRQSNEIVRQALDRLPKGEINVADPKVVYPPKEKVRESIEALIHHFHIASEGFPAPRGEVYTAIESPKGELGFYLVSDGANKPSRLRIRPPSFLNLSALPQMVEGRMIADVVAIIGSIDIVLAEIDR